LERELELIRGTKGVVVRISLVGPPEPWVRRYKAVAKAEGVAARSRRASSSFIGFPSASNDRKMRARVSRISFGSVDVPDDVASVVAFFASDDSAGQALNVC